jgi:molybdate transport system substrate-binding protein
MLRSFAALALALASLACGGGARDGALEVFAAASLRDALVDLEAVWGAPLAVHTGPSNLLAEQIRAGARADLFLSAGEREVDVLAAEGLLAEDLRCDLLGNALVVVQPEPLPAGLPRVERLEDLAAPELGRVALADPAAVPAGRYARAWLEARGLWGALEPRAVAALDVRAALALVESGAVGAGIVYRTDVAQSTRAREVLAAEGDGAPRIVYPVAVLRDAPEPERARELYAFLRSGEARAVFEAHGFALLP